MLLDYGVGSHGEGEQNLAYERLSPALIVSDPRWIQAKALRPTDVVTSTATTPQGTLNCGVPKGPTETGIDQGFRPRDEFAIDCAHRHLVRDRRDLSARSLVGEEFPATPRVLGRAAVAGETGDSD